MVDMTRVKDRVMKSAYVGAGTFASTYVGNLMADFVPGGDLGVAAGNVVVGTGVSVAADEITSRRDSVPNNLVEFAGYGIAGAGFAEAADTLSAGSQTGARVVEVSGNAGAEQTGANNTRQFADEEFSLDV